ncbi:MAG: hypothetical protein DLM67_18460 [Candidatus Nephthysia bennettiae]|nr:MAG: hypothetical protein DLM67_18460 [Candidatus Dormibacteraeota bacterium]
MTILGRTSTGRCGWFTTRDKDATSWWIRLASRSKRDHLKRAASSVIASLGFALSTALVEAHGGTVELVQGREGTGATFRLIMLRVEGEGID